MKIISLNVALFEKNNRKLKTFFTSYPADILCLQEVTRKIDSNVNSAYISKPTIDLANPKLIYSFFAPLWLVRNFNKSNFHRQKLFSINYSGFLEFGTYIRTRCPIIFGQNIFIQDHLTYQTEWSNWPETDSRAIQVADIRLDNNQKLRLINYHGIWTKDKQGNKQTVIACRKILKIAQAVGHPSLICGDFNLFPDTPSMQVLSREYRSLVDEFNIKSTRPETNELSGAKRNVVDYILVDPRIKVNHFAVLTETVSDHLPLYLDFDL